MLSWFTLYCFVSFTQFICFLFDLQEFTYKTIELLDLPDTQICQHFPNLFDFIDLGSKNGAVLVHWYDASIHTLLLNLYFF